MPVPGPGISSFYFTSFLNLTNDTMKAFGFSAGASEDKRRLVVTGGASEDYLQVLADLKPFCRGCVEASRSHLISNSRPARPDIQRSSNPFAPKILGMVPQSWVPDPRRGTASVGRKAVDYNGLWSDYEACDDNCLKDRDSQINVIRVLNELVITQLQEEYVLRLNRLLCIVLTMTCKRTISLDELREQPAQRYLPDDEHHNTTTRASNSKTLREV
ncbi:hypothetical protein CEK25_003250 [Fusarium fujikuroi]|nr:hypothetical protein CEK25_003250 [Fusarium fujikuroi]